MSFTKRASIVVLTSALVLALSGPAMAPLAVAAETAKPAAAAAQPPSGDKVLAVVNGTPITQEMYDQYGKERTAARPGNGNADKKTILDELINRELVLQDSLKRNVDKDPEVIKQLAEQRNNLIVAAGLRSWLDTHPISDKELQKFYDEQLKSFDNKEYKAKHILVKSEDEAKDIIAKLDKGADFAALAKEKSEDKSASDGGELGWFRSGQMVKPFADAAAELKKGKYTEKPVKTDFGWHVIFLEDTREVEPPSLDSVKDRLKVPLQRAELQDYIKELRDKAKVEVKD